MTNDAWRFFKSGIRIRFGVRKAGHGLTVLDDDVFIVSYPKSGNTWVRFILGALIFSERIDWRNMDFIVPDIYRMTDKELLRTRRPRFLKSHSSYDKRYKKIVYIVRNPEKVAISYFYYMLKFKRRGYSENSESLNKFLLDFMAGSIDDFGNWDINVRSWLHSPQANNEDLIICKYEDLVNDPGNQVRRILEFLGIQRSDEEIFWALDWASKDNMHRLEEMQSDSNFLKNTNLKYSFVSLRNEASDRLILNDHQRKLLRSEFAVSMQELGYLEK